MDAAIYARKSTDDKKEKDDETKSVALQIESAKVFAIAKGWSVAPEHIFSDDKISGAEFAKRPEFMRMMHLLVPQAPFQFLIVSEQKSIGREMSETAYVIKQLAEAGVQIFEYMEGRCLTPKNYLDKAMSAIQGMADEAHRADTSKRVRQAHTKMHKMGLVVGGRVFGYRNVHHWKEVDRDGNPRGRSTTREINPIEKDVVLRIFQMFDSGLGLKRIAKTLTSENAPRPEPQKRKDGLSSVKGWSPTTVKAILCRELYHGVAVWNKSKKRDDWGKKNQTRRDKSEWVRHADENLRIVPEGLWLRVVARRQDTESRTVRFCDGRLSGRPPKAAAQNLLAGLAKCGVCGGGIIVETIPGKAGREPEYICGRHRRNGSCENALRIPVAEMNEAILSAIEEHALTPEAIEQVIQLSERDDFLEKQGELEREQKKVAKHIMNITNAIALGAAPASLLAKLKELETRHDELSEQMTCLRPIPRLAPGTIKTLLDDWRRILRQSTTQGRAVIQRIVKGRITFEPKGASYNFWAETRFEKLFAGCFSPRPKWLAKGQTTGLEHLGPEDTLDADYGRLLDRVSGGATV